jgi:hypothetical protein
MGTGWAREVQQTHRTYDTLQHATYIVTCGNTTPIIDQRQSATLGTDLKTAVR